MGAANCRFLVTVVFIIDDDKLQFLVLHPLGMTAQALWVDGGSLIHAVQGVLIAAFFNSERVTGIVTTPLPEFLLETAHDGSVRPPTAVGVSDAPVVLLLHLLVCRLVLRIPFAMVVASRVSVRALFRADSHKPSITLARFRAAVMVSSYFAALYTASGATARPALALLNISE